MLEELKNFVKTTSIKHLGQVIKRRTELFRWVQSHDLYRDNISLTHNIYNIINNIQFPLKCNNGKERKFRSFNDGYVFCGRAGQCQCAQEYVSQKVSKSKQAYSDEKKLEIVEKKY